MASKAILAVFLIAGGLLLGGCFLSVPGTPSENRAVSPQGVTESLPATSPLPASVPANSVVSVLRVVSPGDVTAEGVEIENDGDTVDIGGWTLSNAGGSTFTFPPQLLFSNARVTVYTRAGANTPTDFYWGKSAAVWQRGDTATLRDRSGIVQSSFLIP